MLVNMVISFVIAGRVGFARTSRLAVAMLGPAYRQAGWAPPPGDIY